jgi:hypothetical protein
MKKFLIVIGIFVLLPALAVGQEAASKGRGFVFFAPGVAVGEGSTTGFLHFGAGGEVNLYKGLGFGAEVGYMAPMHYMSEGVGALSINGLYYHGKSGSKVAPFVTGGYTLLFRSGHLNALNFGGGVDCWFAKRAGLRLEVHDYVSPKYLENHLIQGRIALVFR